MPKRALLSLTFAATLAATMGPFEARAEPYIVIPDPAEIAMDDDTPNIAKWRSNVLDAYEAAGQPLPEVLSIWTAFPMAGNNYSTYIDPRANDVQGIGLDAFFPPDGIKESTTPPLRALLWHNNVHVMDARASLHDAPVEGYARYLFLLELSHLWGPAARAPMPGESDLIGFPYHWSFFNDMASPAGGNAWTDNGDGTFTVVPGDPATVGFHMLDLYLMGLAEAAEVQPFSVLVNPVVPATPTDPFWGGAYAPRSFPWFDASSTLTVTATRRELTIDDVIAANGPRIPGAGVKTSWTIGFVLVVAADATAEDVADAKAAFDPIVEGLAPAFSDATMGRGTLEVVTNVAEGGGGGGAGGAPGTGGSDPGPSSTGSGSEQPPDDADGGDDGCGCRSAKRSDASVLGLVLALALALRKKRR